MKTFESIIKKTASYISSAGVVVALITIAFTLLNILLRTFYQSIEGATELIGLSLIFIIGWGLAYTEVKGRNIRVDALVERFPKKAQQIIEVIVNFLYLGIFALMTYGSFMFGLKLYQDIGERIPILNISAFPFRIMLAFGFFVLSLVILTKLINSIKEVFKQWNR